jgi:hypothetical protein
MRMSTHALATWLWVSFGLYLLGSVFEIASTWLLISRGRGEVWRPSRWLINKAGIRGWVTVHVALLVICAFGNHYMVSNLWRGLSPQINLSFLVTIGFYLAGGLFRTIVTFWNLR